MSGSEPTGGADDLAAIFGALNDSLYATDDRAAAFQRIAELAVETIPGCRWAAITVWPAKQPPHSLGSSGEVAVAVDRIQFELREGPCLAAASAQEVVRIDDLAAEERWPTFAEAVRSQTPVRGVVSFHLGDEPHRTALNLYTDSAGGIDTGGLSTAALFVVHARVLLLHAASTDEVVNLRAALTTSRQIGAAVGILMYIHRTTEDEAFALLRTTSQNLNRKLKDIASEVTRTGTLPDS